MSFTCVFTRSLSLHEIPFPLSCDPCRQTLKLTCLPCRYHSGVPLEEGASHQRDHVANTPVLSHSQHVGTVARMKHIKIPPVVEKWLILRLYHTPLQRAGSGLSLPSVYLSFPHVNKGKATRRSSTASILLTRHTTRFHVRAHNHETQFLNSSPQSSPLTLSAHHHASVYRSYSRYLAHRAVRQCPRCSPSQRRW